MMKTRTCLLIIAFALICFNPGIACAEYARVDTPKGPLNMRRAPDSGAGIIEYIPRGEWIEAERTDGEWSRVRYAGRDGYVKTEYLNLTSQLTGRVVYPDGAYLYVRQEPDACAPSAAVVRADEPMTILEADKDWVQVSCMDGERQIVRGYVRMQDIKSMRETPGESRAATLSAGLELSAERVSVGEVLDAAVTGGGASCQYRLYREGELVFEGKPVEHERASYRPREEGRYRLEVIVRDDEGRSIGCDAVFEVWGEAKMQESLYSQKDGWWIDKAYGRRNLDSSGCAIFTLSHALERTGKGSEAALPENLAQAYGVYLAESGTLNSRLLSAAGRDFGFSTSAKKIGTVSEMIRRFEAGAVFSFLIVRGHVAMAAELSEDQTKVKIVDSAPSATFERIENAALYVQDENGSFREAKTLWDIPGARYYFETDAFGALEYYLDARYVAGRGLRLIQPKE